MSRTVRPRCLVQLREPRNHGSTRASTEWRLGFLAAVNFVNDLKVGNNGYLAGDCALLKYNLITKRQVRKVPKPRVTAAQKREGNFINDHLNFMARGAAKAAEIARKDKK